MIICGGFKCSKKLSEREKESEVSELVCCVYASTIKTSNVVKDKTAQWFGWIHERTWQKKIIMKKKNLNETKVNELFTKCEQMNKPSDLVYWLYGWWWWWS